MSFERVAGEHAGERAELNVYSNGTSRLMIELETTAAFELADAAVSTGGIASIEVHFGGKRIPARVIEGRINTVDLSGNKLTGPGVISFMSLKRR